MKRIFTYHIISFLCSLLVLTACSQEEKPVQDDEICITSLNAGLFDVRTRAVDSYGFDGVVKSEFVANDMVTIYKDGRRICDVTCNGGGSWSEMNPPLKLVNGKRSIVKISYNNDEIYAVAVYDRTQWKTDEPDCWGSISTSAENLTAVLNHSRALVTVESINSSVGDVRSIQSIIGGSTLDFIGTVDKTWAWEQMAAAGQSITGFVVTLTDDTDIEIDLDSPVVTQANKQYTFRITMKYGEYRAWEVKSSMGNPPEWGESGSYGSAQTIIYDEEGLMGIANDLDGNYILANDITLDQSVDWIPIGTSRDNAFSGKLDGNGYVINGLKIGKKDNPASHDYAGLFGYVREAELLNMHIGNAEIYTTGIAAGAVAGCAENTLLDLCSTSPVGGSIANNTIQVTGRNIASDQAYAEVYAGGIVGLLYEKEADTYSRIIRCWNMNTTVKAIGTANQSKTHSGGLVGRNNYGGFVSSYSYRVDVYATGPTSTCNYSGGIIGSSVNDSRNSILAYGCCAREKFSESTEAAGGSAGANVSGDFIGEAKGTSGYDAKIASCWAWKNGHHESSENLIHEFIVIQENIILEKCFEHDCNMNDFLELKDAEEIVFDNKTWEAKYIWDTRHEDVFPQIILSYSGNAN